MEKKISVIVPIYNADKYLKQTLDSVRFQTYKNLEIVCVLDCPTDNSEKIVNDIAKEDNRVKIVKHSRNMGPAEARNNGIQYATGEYIHFMDADDFLNPDFYGIMINSSVENDADVAVSSVFNEKNPTRSIWFQGNEILFNSDKIYNSMVLVQGWSWRYLIKKNFWDNNNFLFPNLMVMEDTAVALPMLYHANKVVTCPDAVYFYKNREDSILNKKGRNAEEKKIWKENLRNARKIRANFIRKYNIKEPSILKEKLSKRLRKRVICKNAQIEYGKITEKISVIIPIYNAEKYLKQTLDSVRFQTYQHLEIVCVLDCPNDNSAEIVKEIALQDNRIKLVEHSKNRGLPAARNSGAENAGGEYIHFMDADDLLSPDFYEVMISAAEKNNADISACSVFYEKKQWRSVWFQNSEILSNKNDKIKKTEVVISSWAWRYLIKKSFWNEHQFSFPDLVPMEDLPVMIPMIYYANKIVLCPSAVYFYKYRESSILNQNSDKERKKRHHDNRQKARKIFREFMRIHKIKEPSRLLHSIKRRFV
ncbi:MAG: glycosyltransferase family 2 protein [Chitinispirillales bacterium]|jgi:glycosyltransferase involved in cell wall biosynthesis|nr:glycosyltransferase family 2 protein [Chitinispirillales bacterium]